MAVFLIGQVTYAQKLKLPSRKANALTVDAIKRLGDQLGIEGILLLKYSSKNL